MNLNKYWSKRVSRFKAIELQVYQNQLYFNINKRFHINEGGISANFNICNLFGYYIGWNRKCDHAGVRTSITVFGLDFSFEFYDVRHWDDDNDCPMPIDETLFTLK